MKRIVPVLALALLLSGCASLKLVFTAQGQKVLQARNLLADNHPLGAAALAAEAVALEPKYEEAIQLLSEQFAPGQKEFREAVARENARTDGDRWDQLVSLYTWQQTLVKLGPTLPAIPDPAGGTLDFRLADVSAELSNASRQASLAHLATSRALRQANPSVAQARKALEEARKANSYDPTTPGLADWLDEATKAAYQRLLVLPFDTMSQTKLGPVTSILVSQLGTDLSRSPELPELTSIYTTDASLQFELTVGSFGGLSRAEARRLASKGGENLVLFGQITLQLYEPVSYLAKTEVRKKTITVIDAAHPEGYNRTYQALVTTTTASTTFVLQAMYSLADVATGEDRLAGLRDVKLKPSVDVVTFTGDAEALTEADAKAIANPPELIEPQQLKLQAIRELSQAIAAHVLRGL